MSRFGIVSWYVLLMSRMIRGECEPLTTAAHLARSINVKTVIFKETDCDRPCFDSETIQMLLARRVMQDLLPKLLTRDFSALLEFVNRAEVVLKMRMEESNELMFMKQAFYDAFGGYLHAYTMPVLNEEYYAGNVEYVVANELHSTMRRMKTYLGTNGGGWADPCDMSRVPVKVSPLCVNLHLRDQSCENFVLAEDMTTDAGDSDSPAFRLPDCGPETPKIQLPFLDDNDMPSAVALPIRERSLFSLMTSCAVNIFPKYYVLAMRCLSSAQFTDVDRVFFNQKLYEWITITVVPHLKNSDRFYAGFGGVMKVVETINEGGLTSSGSFRTPPKNQNASNFFTADIDEKWYATYVKKFGGAQILILIAAILLLLSVVIVVCYLITRAFLGSGGGGDGEVKCYEDVEEHCYEDVDAGMGSDPASGRGEGSGSKNETGTSATYSTEVKTQCRSSGTSRYLGTSGPSEFCISTSLTKPYHPSSSSTLSLSRT